ncbi:HWE histidine kinase domain-containing protein [Bradyrhizobium septentrionale]|uniref:histidine kinase n=2 Tax=Bradyrhizobium septentrionale TaxID=1404411 RepID=A0ABZ2NW88_9BRAD|nr:HWE histidine kinase domain-containing protein [Bradyrhizobium septentrionale]UGY17564.1 PAS domain-containing protein [Bradyrhizobium septentrionale]
MRGLFPLAKSDCLKAMGIGRKLEGDFPPGVSDVAALIRAFDWPATSLGPIMEWPAHLKSAVSLMLPAKAQIVLFWGPEFVALYNDAYAPTIGQKHPKALGRPARENWTELWDDLEPLLRRVLDTGETVFAKDRPFYIERHGYPETVYFDISYSPVQDEFGEIGGVLCIVSETTERVVAQERQRLLAREANHRVKNMFAVFHGIINLSARSARTPQEMAQSLRGRLNALMQAKDLIRPGIMGTEAHSERTTVGDVVRTVLRPYEDDASRERIMVRGPHVPVGAMAVTSLALALHETTTNAAKYGALSEPTGSVSITWETHGGDLHLEWVETGGPVIVAPPSAKGFGSVLAERSIADQLGGKVEHDWLPSGLRLRVSVPLDRLAV